MWLTVDGHDVDAVGVELRPERTVALADLLRSSARKGTAEVNFMVESSGRQVTLRFSISPYPRIDPDRA